MVWMLMYSTTYSFVLYIGAQVLLRGFLESKHKKQEINARRGKNRTLSRLGLSNFCERCGAGSCTWQAEQKWQR
jgi:hypothetical protein